MFIYWGKRYKWGEGEGSSVGFYGMKGVDAHVQSSIS